jgi:hypothetical protein
MTLVSPEEPSPVPRPATAAGGTETKLLPPIGLFPRGDEFASAPPTGSGFRIAPTGAIFSWAVFNLSRRG